MTDTRRRVKLYALNADRQWDDRGTGHVSSAYVDRLKGVSLLVRAESDGSLLLESKILPDTAYQKQQETLIVWSEGDNYDLALSFQEKVGCEEIWAKICSVQGKDPSVEITQEIVEEEDERYDDPSEMTGYMYELPPCEIERLDEINDIIANSLPFPIRREKLGNVLERENYIKNLLGLFHTCEEVQNLKALHKLYEIFKNMFMLNKNSLFDIMLNDENSLFDLVGIFEYDPSQPQPKRHREYLKSESRFKQVLPFANTDLINKIHQTYRVQYIQEVVLPAPSVIEENMLSTLSQFIFLNKVEIVNLVQEDEHFLTQLFTLIPDETTSQERRRDLVLFLKEFCLFSQTLQPQNRENFFKTLSSLGILPTLEVTLAMNDPIIKSSSVDILTYIVEYSPSMIREYALQQEANTDKDQLIINIIIEQMISSQQDLGLVVQLSSMLRLLLDPENMLSATANKSEKSEFLNYFYKNCMPVLTGKIKICSSNSNSTNNATNNKKDDLQASIENNQQAQLYSLILELLSFCVEHHAYCIRTYIINNDLLRNVLYLMKTKYTFLVLSALRFLRKIVGLKDEVYNRYIITNNLFEIIIEVFNQNKGRYNLLDSAIIELFEFIRTDEIKMLYIYIIDKFGQQLERIEYVKTFQGLRKLYDQHYDYLKEKNNDNNSRYRRDPRELDEDEDIWFNQNDEDDHLEDDGLNDSMNYNDFGQFNKKLDNNKKNNINNLNYSELSNVKKYNELDNVKTLNSSNKNSNNTPRKTTQLNNTLQTSQLSTGLEVQNQMKGLVEYDEDSEEECEDEIINSTAKRAKLSSS